MNLSAKLLNSDASLNSWREIGSVDFTPGENIRIVLRLWDLQEDIRYLPEDAAAVLTVTFNTTNSTLDKTATLDPKDQAFATVDLTQAETQDLISGSVKLSLDEKGDGTEIRKGVVRNALRVVNPDC